jgi:hypothetical protein
VDVGSVQAGVSSPAGATSLNANFIILVYGKYGTSHAYRVYTDSP